MRKLAAILTALALVLPATAAAKAHASRRHQSSPVQFATRPRPTRQTRQTMHKKRESRSAPLTEPEAAEAACAGWGYTLT